MTPEASGSAGEGASEHKGSDMRTLVDVRYVNCPECHQRIRAQLYSVVSQCHTWCPRCKKNVHQCVR
ncbi:hypothetical protein FHU10_0998 [Serratia fonticola]|jgi:uncharacterized paraquat-inducible protein A|uniref:Uncharacterized protein n=1 Tax=Serratia fonticola TaxID=47917 RepID=A0A559T1Q9_SERFO|nr:hypothetical protein [Serratia fonticola]TQI78957.1 hypothetical protein FHU09_1451 [Serratia fonticola]TQI99021.1 hypothetical protein FHU11_4599 [Serratia fonticola]TVZ68546.1 hypothetical protein FHU10_0998 [Serratia fonticola]